MRIYQLSLGSYFREILHTSKQFYTLVKTHFFCQEFFRLQLSTNMKCVHLKKCKQEGLLLLFDNHLLLILKIHFNRNLKIRFSVHS